MTIEGLMHPKHSYVVRRIASVLLSLARVLLSFPHSFPPALAPFI